MVSICGSLLGILPLAFCVTQPGLMGLQTRWEFFTTLGFEWRVIRGRQPYRWTIWVCSHGGFFSEQGTLVFRVPACEPRTDFIPGQIYFLTRLTTLMTVIINLVTLNLTTKTNCQVRPALYVYRLRSRFICYDSPRSGPPHLT